MASQQRRGQSEVTGVRTLREMSEIHIGEEVVYKGRAFRVRGLSPMGARRRRILLVDLLTDERIDVPPEALDSPPLRRLEVAQDERAAHDE